MGMRKGLKILLVLCVLMGGLNIAMAAQWTAEQREVWKAVETWWSLYDSNNSLGVKAMIHKNYVGWFWGYYAPEGYTEAAKWTRYMIPQNTKIVYTNLRPMEILVMGDVAVNHYYYATHQMVDGKEEVVQGRWTDVWKKEGGKWLLVADSGGILTPK